jgi:hypothetical protein
VQKIAKHGAFWLSGFLGGKLIGAALTVFLLALGIGYQADDDRLDEAAVAAAKQAGGGEIADGYRAYAKALNDAKASALEVVPEGFRENLDRYSLVIAGVGLGLGVVLVFVHAPSRADIAKEIGWGIAGPGVAAAAATVVLEWRALKGLKATLEGRRALHTLVEEGAGAGIQGLKVLWLPLLVGALATALGASLERHHRACNKERGLDLEHIVSHFLIVIGLVPWIHLAIAVLLDAFTEGSSTGASLAPWVRGPHIYAGCAALFAFGAALYVLGRADAKRLEKG